MHKYEAFPRFLIGLSLAARLAIAIGSTLAFLIVFILLPKDTQNPSIFVVPIALIAWMFRKSGLFLTLIILAIVLWIYYVLMYETIWFPWHLMTYFVVGVFSLLFIGLLVGAQRDAFNLADEAKQQLTIAYDQQQKLFQIKDQFLQNVNHELRTPLTAIYGYLELLLEHNEQLDATLRKTFLERAMKSCDELQLLVDNVLDSIIDYKEKKKPVPVEELCVLDIVHEVLDRFDPKTIQEHTINIYIPEYITVRANPQYTRQVVRNLLSNAFKYSPVGAPIEISVALFGNVVQSSHPLPEVCISVKDAGPGIPSDEIQQLFGQFVRLRRDIASKVCGSGLGLYLSKQFVDLMGGQIWVESEGIAGKGSCFRFTLPCVPHPKIQAQTKCHEIYTHASADTQ
ncbi:MAG TPA: HAMP domain-containing sensor histidine kinase [Ktedonobacteraceae bacterium]|jgi:signal transduction histidine kinase